MLVKNIARNLAVIACCLLNEFTCICQTNFLIFFILQDYDTSHPQWEFLQMIRYVSPARYCWLVCIVWDLLIWREYCSHLDLRPLVGNESVSCTHLLNATVLKWTLPSIKGVGLPKNYCNLPFIQGFTVLRPKELPSLAFVWRGCSASILLTALCVVFSSGNIPQNLCVC